MKQETLKITTGAMFIAIFAILMLINRQTGGMFEGVMFYLLPIPMVAYSAKFGFKSGLPVLFAMGIMAFLFGNVTSVIYAMTAAFTGLIFGTCIYKKVEGTKTLFTVMVVSGFGEIVNMILFAMLMGFDIHKEADEYRVMIMESMQKAVEISANPQGEQLLSMYDQLLTPDMMLRMLVISTILGGLIQGFITYKISLLILNKLRFQIPKPVSIFSYVPPRWSSFLAIDFFILYNLAPMVANETIRSVLQTIGLCAYMYLVFFGFLQVILYFRKRSGSKVIGFVLGFLLMMTFSLLLLGLGIYYMFNHKGEVPEKTAAGKKEPELVRMSPHAGPNANVKRKGSMAYKANLADLSRYGEAADNPEEKDAEEKSADEE